MASYKKYSTLDIMLLENKVKLIQLSCFTDLNKLDWMNTPVYDLMYTQPPNADSISKDEQDKFEKLVLQCLGRDVRRPKFLTFSQWIQEGGSGLQTLWSIYYIDKLNKDTDKPLILCHYERFHPLCYKQLLFWFTNQAESKEIILLSTNSTIMLDCYDPDLELNRFKKFIELNNGDIVTVEDFCFKVMGRDKKIIEKPWLYDVEKIYRKYCEFGAESTE